MDFKITIEKFSDLSDEEQESVPESIRYVRRRHKGVTISLLTVEEAFGLDSPKVDLHDDIDQRDDIKLLWKPFSSIKELPIPTHTKEVAATSMLVFGIWKDGKGTRRLSLIYWWNEDWHIDGTELFLSTLENTTWHYWSYIGHTTTTRKLNRF